MKKENKKTDVNNPDVQKAMGTEQDVLSVKDKGEGVEVEATEVEAVQEEVNQDKLGQDKAAEMSPEALLGQQLVHLEKSLAETKDQLLRTAAEYDNFRKRTTREKEQLYADSVQDVVLAWLPLVDNLDRAIHAAKTLEGADQEMIKGVEMIQRQAYMILEQLQVEEISALGEVFDPNLHHAVMQVEDEAYGSQEIVEVFQKGFKRGERVLRAAVVKVANS